MQMALFREETLPYTSNFEVAPNKKPLPTKCARMERSDKSFSFKS